MKVTVYICVVISTLAILLGQSEGRKKKKVSGEAHGFGTPITKFSLDLFKILVAESFKNGTGPENVVFSPSSAFRALLLLRFATGNNSQVQMDKALHIEDVSDVTSSYRKWKGSKLDGVKEADRLYHDSSVSVVGNIKSILGSEITSVSLTNEGTVEQINSWVSQATQGQITELVKTIENDVRLILLSALYMKAEWAIPFSKVTTKEFTLTDGSTVNVPMMFKEDQLLFHYSGDLKTQVVALEYRNSPLKFVVFLPSGDQTLDKLATSLSSEAIDTVMNSLFESKVELHLPKFRVEKDIKLTTLCQELGMTDIFDISKAKLPSFKSTEPLYVKEVLQKVVVDVDKQGTTASAVTKVTVGSRSSGIEIVANKPFMYVVYDSSSRTPLFMGTMMNPNE